MKNSTYIASTPNTTRQARELPTFGIGADLAETQWRSVLRQLIAKNMVRVNTEAFNTLQLMADARGVLKGELSVLLREQVSTGKSGSSNGSGKARASKRSIKTSVKGLAEAALNSSALERLAYGAEVRRVCGQAD